MTKTLLHILVLMVLCACNTSSVGTQIADDSLPFVDSLFYDVPDTNAVDVDVVTKDSAKFRIVRVYLVSGRLFEETIIDSVKGKRYEKQYRRDGRLYYEGAMNDEYDYHIGTWKYYYPDGRIKEINYDSTNQVSHFKAIQILKSYGYKTGRLEAAEEVIDNIIYWRAIEWIEEDSMGGEGRFILIRRSNGEVTVPNPNEVTYRI